MSIITRMQKMTCCYWPPQSVESAGDDFDNYGVPLYSTPYEISCRWEDVAEEFIDAEGTTRISRAKVFADRDLAVGGVLMLGELTDITDEDNPKENENAWEIMRFDKIPNLKCTEFLRVAFV